MRRYFTPGASGSLPGTGLSGTPDATSLAGAGDFPPSLLLFALAGGLDEYIFHHDIPGEESDLHAKEHLALLIFIVVSLATDWLEKNHWNLAQALTQLHRAPGGTR